MIKIRATFKGTDSLGYKNGHVYSLILKGNLIIRTTGGGLCRYASIAAFHRNWEKITRINNP